jgi:hypothetical protein
LAKQSRRPTPAHERSPSIAITPRSERGDRVHGERSCGIGRPTEEVIGPLSQASVAALGEDQPSADRASGGLQ